MDVAQKLISVSIATVTQTVGGAGWGGGCEGLRAPQGTGVTMQSKWAGHYLYTGLWVRAAPAACTVSWSDKA